MDDGYRLALVYNLVTCAQSQAFTPADNSKAMKGMLKAIEEWAEDEQGPEKLVIPLEGDYFVQDLSVDKLEGADRARGNAILQASTVGLYPVVENDSRELPAAMLSLQRGLALLRVWQILSSTAFFHEVLHEGLCACPQKNVNLVACITGVILQHERLLAGPQRTPG